MCFLRIDLKDRDTWHDHQENKDEDTDKNKEKDIGSDLVV